jgi:hypothetical protein
VDMTGDRDDHGKAGAWVLEVRDGSISTGRYIPPPLSDTDQLSSRPDPS